MPEASTSSRSSGIDRAFSTFTAAHSLIGPAQAILPARQRTPALLIRPMSRMSLPVVDGLPFAATVTSREIFLMKRSKSAMTVMLVGRMVKRDDAAGVKYERRARGAREDP